MLFTQLEFLLFFIAVLSLAWLTRRRATRHFVLLLASYYFYAYWDYRFCGLIVLSTLVDYCVAKGIVSTGNRKIKGGLLAVSMAVNLGLLAFFKYFNFFIDSAAPILESLGVGTSSLSIILPVGISFYTFQTLSYTIDVYRGVIKPVESWLDFALYVSFFPQLVAGPIVRASEFLPQLQRVPSWSRRRFYGGAQQMLRGAIKKVIFADRLAEMVDVVFSGPELYSGLTLWIAALAYACQIYYDFSGYSDMAIGAAKMLGYRFPVNFRHPYLASSLSEFWRRWHMTLSRWLRDYLYFSLGGSRQGTMKTYRNLILTMLVGGLWHGAAWTFVVWGLLHGVGLSVERWCRTQGKVFANRMGLSPDPLGSKLSWIGALINAIFALVVVILGWILFRSENFGEAAIYYGRLFTWSDGIDWFPPLVIAAITCLVFEHLAWNTRLRGKMRLPFDAWYSPVLTVVMLWVLLLYVPNGFKPFVYFQF